MTKILLVEDDANICTAVRLLLEQENWEVDEAPTAEDGIAQFQEDEHDLILLDLMLPEMDGFEFCRYMRTRSTVPIIILTARTDSLVEGLTAGADDYVMKPFVPQELMARINSLLRRVEGEVITKSVSEEDGESQKYGKLEVFESGKVFRDGLEIKLTRTEWKLFQEFLKEPGNSLTREQLSERIWRDKEFSTSRLVDIQVSRLRIKLEEDIASPRFIKTVRKVGYKFDPEAL